MKTTLKFSALLVALASVFTFSSCLNSSDDSSYPTYSSYVTIAGDDVFGYTFHTDFGATLKPTSSSVTQVLPGLSGSNVKRAYVAFDLVSETENGKELEKGKTYDVVLRESYYANYAIPTFSTLRLTEASDTLVTKNKRINDVNKDIWAINGYANAQMTISYDQYKNFSMNAYYADEDVDAANNKLTLNLYYNSNSETHTGQATSIFSFKLPENLAYNFQTDTITLVMKAMSDYEGTYLKEVGSCKVAVKDFFAPGY